MDPNGSGYPNGAALKAGFPWMRAAPGMRHQRDDFKPDHS